MSNVQMTALCDWLLELQNKKYAGPKFIVSPVPMFPVRSMNHTLAVASDGWERYPESMATLLHHIVIHELDNVVILSGDAHCFHDVTTEVKHEKNTIQIRSVTTPGLYSPYPFANRQPNEVLSAASGSLEAMGVQWTYGETRACASLAGWVELRARVSCGQIEVNLHDVGTA